MNNIEMPFYLSRLPRDRRGWPITYTSLKLPDGTIDFTTTDPLRWMECAQGRSCGLCGIVLKRLVWFIGGPKCFKYRVFFDLPMHEECARYAMIVCPYLSMPKYLGAKSRPTPEALRKDIVSADKIKPGQYMLSRTNGYRIVNFQGDVLVRANAWDRTEWWKDGKQLTGDEK